MNKPITVGTLVRVRTDADLTVNDRAAIATGGLLWLRTSEDVSDPLRGPEHGRLLYYTSLATGEEYPWFDTEVEIPDEEA